MKKMISAMLLVVVILTMMPMQVFAGGNPYRDVTTRKVDTNSYSAIVYVKDYNGWKGLTKKGKLYPNRYMTRREFLKVLHNLYGDKVPATIIDVLCANGKITASYVCNKLAELSKVLGYPIKWNGTSMKMRRTDVARYIKIFATYNSALKPRK